MYTLTTSQSFTLTANSFDELANKIADAAPFHDPYCFQLEDGSDYPKAWEYWDGTISLDPPVDDLDDLIRFAQDRLGDRYTGIQIVRTADEITQEHKTLQTQQDVTIYSTPNCQACRITQKALEKAGVPFEIVDLSQRPELIDEFHEQGLVQAPVVEFNGERTAGFRPDRLKAIAASLTRPTPQTITTTDNTPNRGHIPTPPSPNTTRTR